MEEQHRRAAAEVIRICREQGRAISQMLAAYTVRAVLLQNMQKEAKLDDTAWEQCVRRGVELLSRKESAATETLALQVAVDATFLREGQAVEAEQVQRDQTAQSALNEAVQIKVVTEREEAVALQKEQLKVFEYVALRNGLRTGLADTPTTAVAEAETAAALESVFPWHNLRRWMTFGKNEKAAQLQATAEKFPFSLQELATITLGIRVLNKFLGKGGVGLEMGASQYQARGRALAERLDQELTWVAKQIEQGTAVINHRAQRYRTQEKEVKLLRDELVYRCQYQQMLENVARENTEGLAIVAELEAKQGEMQAVLQAAIGTKHAVPKDTVFPHLHALGTLHTVLLEEMRVLEAREGAAGELLTWRQPFPSQYGYADVQEAYGRSGTPAPLLLDDAGPRTPDDLAAAEAASGSARVRPDDIPAEEGAAIVPQLAGFCPVTLVRRNGLPLRGNPGLGYVKFSGALYSFLDGDSLSRFAASPAAFLESVHVLVATHPQLVRLLGLQSSFPSLNIRQIAQSLAAPLKCDFGTQTPTHFVEKHLDHKYEWNEWALRRRALQLANLRTKATHSAQTNLSHFRRDGETQVRLPKEAATQSGIAGTNKMTKKLRLRVQSWIRLEGRGGIIKDSSWMNPSAEVEHHSQDAAPAEGCMRC
ncbi:hypothetical protein KFL_000200590 [Klebsormidium nitens]|uniref:Cilia- and flagella-associated protein 206 n=1 Tax=Klebsormidium nitens TaxID=105231 RepID=A0A1Y1HQP0_KLENI|nr:hypothetical protein KFL_000200590 [Klebsormidium nitens]|eukprot:GAQ78906.1 hypothetical protein KFL_000200590 [Klebsormidium nitens]